jgi:uncharacterized membrane protein HdeD (DUF308 family)
MQGEGRRRTALWPLYALRNVGRNARTAVEGESSYLVHHAILLCAGIVSAVIGMIAMDLFLPRGASQLGGFAVSLATYGLVGLFDRTSQRRERWWDWEMPFYGVASLGAGILLVMVPHTVSSILPFGTVLTALLLLGLLLLIEGFRRRSAA